MPACGQGEGQVHAEALLMERAHGAEDDREGRALVQLPGAAGHGLGHADQVARLGLVLDRDDDGVLFGGAHAGVELVQHARLDGAVLGRHECRGGGDVVEPLNDLGRRAHVGLGRGAHRAVVLAHEGGAAVRGDVGVLAVERQVERRRAAAEREAVGQGGQGALDELGRQLGDGRLVVDLAPASASTSRARFE